MNEVIIVLVILLVMYLLGKYAIEQGVRVEQQKEFEKNLNNYDNTRKNKNNYGKSNRIVTEKKQ
tara:strand:+ start:765 stop:956 length:192 start_codon:yes stop_codon:yes gene_type:complete